MINTKSKIIKLTLVLTFLSVSIFGWGRTGHINITKHAFELLKQKVDITNLYKDSVVAKSNDPDKRVRTIKEQAPWHFIDIDFYKEFNNLNMITNYDSLVSIYGENEVKKQGTLPWVIETNQNKLIEAFKNKNTTDILFYSAEIAHFVADAHMPLHTTTNYDGQLTNQKGIHSRYESKMVEKYLDKIEQNFYQQPIIIVEEPLSTAFEIIDNSYPFVQLLLDADKKAYELAHSNSTDMYYDLLWKQTDYITYIQLNNAAKFVASYIYSAWYKAGMPKIENLIN
jgi:hypothetical protein